MSTKITRRKFLIGTAAGIGVAAVACSGLTAFAVHAPVDPSFEKLATGENPMNQKVLVTYGSKAGSTMEIAQAIADELSKRGFTVDICPVKRVEDVKQYSQIVIGSAIRMSSPLAEVKKFVEKNRADLSNIPTAFFAVYLMNMEEDDASRKARLAYLDPIRNLIPLQDEAFFTGVFDPTKVSFIEGLMGKSVKSPEGDFRDWSAISNWGQTIFA